MSILQDVMNEICPCDNCIYNEACKNDKLACIAFAQYVVYGRFDIKCRKNPDVIIYSKVFEDGLTKIELKEFKRKLKEFNKKAEKNETCTRQKIIKRYFA